MTALDLQMHHLGAGRAIAWVLTALSIAAILDTVLQPPVDRTGLAIIAASVVVMLLSVLLGLRPTVQELPASLMVRNPWRTTVIPWTCLVDVRSSDVLVVDTTGGPVRCFALPRRVRRSLSGSAVSALGRYLPESRQSDTPTEAPTTVVMERLLTQAKSLSHGQSASTAVVRSTVDVTAVVLTALAAVASVVCLVLAFG